MLGRDGSDSGPSIRSETPETSSIGVFKLFLPVYGAGDLAHRRKISNGDPAHGMVPNFRAVPISCPIGHHIGFMVTNDVPIFPDTEHEMTLYGGYLKIRGQRSMKNPGRWSSGFPGFSIREPAGSTASSDGAGRSGSGTP